MRQWRRLVFPAWALVLVIGFLLVARHAARAGDAGSAPHRWPSASAIRHAEDRATLVVIMHPKCPCSRATLRELERLMARRGRDLHAVAVFVRPSGGGEGFERGDLLDSAHAIGGLNVLVDVGGVEARRFGAMTSGQVLLYGAGGELRFAGGLTVARGHEGDSPGASAIEAALGSKKGARTSRVFGCELE